MGSLSFLRKWPLVALVWFSLMACQRDKTLPQPTGNDLPQDGPLFVRITSNSLGSAQTVTLDLTGRPRDTLVTYSVFAQSIDTLARVSASYRGPAGGAAVAIPTVCFSASRQNFTCNLGHVFPWNSVAGNHYLTFYAEDQRGRRDSARLIVQVTAAYAGTNIFVTRANAGLPSPGIREVSQGAPLVMDWQAWAWTGMRGVTITQTRPDGTTSTLLQRTGGFVSAVNDSGSLTIPAAELNATGLYRYQFQTEGADGSCDTAIYEVRVVRMSAPHRIVLFGPAFPPTAPMPPGATIIGPVYNGTAMRTATAAEVTTTTTNRSVFDFAYQVANGPAITQIPAVVPNLPNTAATLFGPVQQPVDANQITVHQLAALPPPTQPRFDLGPLPIGQAFVFYNPVERRKGIAVLEERVIQPMPAGGGNSFVALRVRYMGY